VFAKKLKARTVLDGLSAIRNLFPSMRLPICRSFSNRDRNTKYS